MFNLKKTAKKAILSVKAAMEPVRDPQEVITEIHEAFDAATEKLLFDAKAVLSGSYDTEKGNRLKNVGFVSSEKAVQASKVESEKQYASHINKVVDYYSVYYPHHKFITEQMVKDICLKYGLVGAVARYYIGDIPEKNLSDIERFKLRDEDKVLYTVHEWTASSANRTWSEGRGYYRKTPLSWGSERVYISDENIKEVLEQPEFIICAPIKDFDTKHMRLEDGYKLVLEVPDPIVLQPVKDGFLIITKWGLEASDPIVINPISN